MNNTQISAALVKELRDQTGAGIMDCKQALQKAGGDMEGAIEEIRKSGTRKVAKKNSRLTMEGSIAIEQSGETIAIAELNAETDFVARGEDFQAFTGLIMTCILSKRPKSVEELMLLRHGQQTLEHHRQQLIHKVGENINLRRFEVFTHQGLLGSYLHGKRIGAIVEISGGDTVLAKELAMHIAAAQPLCIDKTNLATDILEKERRIFTAQAMESGKPADLIERIVEGKVNKFIQENTLLGQAFIKDDKISIADLLRDAKANVIRFFRYEVGEGMAKRTDDFVAEVMAQAHGKSDA